MSAAIDKCFCSSLTGMRVSGVVLEMRCPHCYDELMLEKSDLILANRGLREKVEELEKAIGEMMREHE